MSDFQIDKFGGEFRIVDGVETFALWVPMTAAEKEALLNRAKAQKIDVAALAGNCLREWMKVQEVSGADLETVVGGASEVRAFSAERINLADLLGRSRKKWPWGGQQTSSAGMCPW